ncbi:MAG: hypothetical protein Q7R70_02835 [Candidatus Diapherotrites archaeon]|nr:hypothetical protein [Candidatus Diapherotrites archaeon]
MGDSDFNKPVYSGEMFEEKKPSPLEAVKPYFGKIILAIILIAIAYGAYWFFVGSYQNVQVNISGMDKLAVSGISGSISQNGKEIQKITKASQSLSLKEGTYDIEVFADGFKQYSDTIIVDSKKQPVKIQLEKDIDVKIDRIELKLNDSQGKIFAGKDNLATIYLSNSGSSDIDVEIAKDSPEDAKLTVIPDNALIRVPKGSQNVSAGLKIVVSTGYKVTDRTNGDSIELKLRVKGVQSNPAVRPLSIVPKMTIIVSPTTLKFGTVKANGSPSSPAKEISIQNRESFDLQGKIEFSVTIENAGENPKSEVQKWFDFYPEITELKKSSTAKENVTITIPPSTVNFPTGSKTLPVLGTITLASESWNETIKFDMIVSQINTSIKVPTISQSSFSMAGDDIKTTLLTIENNSEVPLTKVKVNVPGSCLNTYLTSEDILEIDELSNIAPQSKKIITFKVHIPADAAIGDPKNCVITVSYDDPLNPGGDQILIDNITPIKITRTS